MRFSFIHQLFLYLSLATFLPASSLELSLRETDGKAGDPWITDEKTGPLVFQSTGHPEPREGTLYMKVSYLDQGYGRIHIRLHRQKGGEIAPDRFLGVSRMNSGGTKDALLRFSGLSKADLPLGVATVRLERPEGETLTIRSVNLQNTPFENAQFQYVISDPWKGPYTGPSIPPAENTTLVGKVMTGYQGWFRTPNDPYGGSWNHWGNVYDGTFSVDMWPDVSHYPAHTLENAADVKLKSGKQAQLFSSAWPEIADTHFRWMREHSIDGAFLQRFVSDNFYSISGKPEWVLANARASARKEGRIWAIEYDVSGCPDGKLLDILRTDWKWLVDEFKLLDDPNYAMEGGKPVVFIWGMPFADRGISPKTANAVVDFFRNDPKYGGNYVIGGIPGNWREMAPEWQEHITGYHCVLSWMSQRYAEDIADFRKLGLPYYAHVKPGFSWANMKHLPTGDDTLAYSPHLGGKYYWDQMARSAEAGSERMFVGMFDEYDEGTAIIPMSDDTPATPSRPGVAATFFNGPNAQEHGRFKLLGSTSVALENSPPADGIGAESFSSTWAARSHFRRMATTRSPSRALPEMTPSSSSQGARFFCKKRSRHHGAKRNHHRESR